MSSKTHRPGQRSSVEFLALGADDAVHLV